MNAGVIDTSAARSAIRTLASNFIKTFEKIPEKLNGWYEVATSVLIQHISEADISQIAEYCQVLVKGLLDTHPIDPDEFSHSLSTLKQNAHKAAVQGMFSKTALFAVYTQVTSLWFLHLKDLKIDSKMIGRVWKVTKQHGVSAISRECAHMILENKQDEGGFNLMFQVVNHCFSSVLEDDSQSAKLANQMSSLSDPSTFISQWLRATATRLGSRNDIASALATGIGEHNLLDSEQFMNRLEKLIVGSLQKISRSAYYTYLEYRQRSIVTGFFRSLCAVQYAKLQAGDRAMGVALTVLNGNRADVLEMFIKQLKCLTISDITLVLSPLLEEITNEPSTELIETVFVEAPRDILKLIPEEMHRIIVGITDQLQKTCIDFFNDESDTWVQRVFRQAQGVLKSVEQYLGKAAPIMEKGRKLLNDVDQQLNQGINAVAELVYKEVTKLFIHFLKHFKHFNAF